MGVKVHLRDTILNRKYKFILLVIAQYILSVQSWSNSIPIDQATNTIIKLILSFCDNNGSVKLFSKKRIKTYICDIVLKPQNGVKFSFYNFL